MLFLRKLLVVAIMVLFMPLASFAAIAEPELDPNLSNVIINIEDQFGEPISGNWYLYRGSTRGGVVRNGLSGETFQVSPGNYLLEVRMPTGPISYESYKLLSEKIQEVKAGETIIYNIEYTKNVIPIHEEKVEKKAIIEDVEDVEEVVTSPIDTIIEDFDTDTETDMDSDIDANETVMVYAPTFETSPEVYSATESSDESLFELAVTGPGLLFLLFPSALAGLAVTRRRK